MIPPLQVSLTPASAALLARTGDWPRKLSANLAAELDRQNELTVGHIVEARATGKGPFPASEGKLGVVTSRYRRSVRRTKASVEGTALTSAIGSNVRYAGAHEFGVNRTVSVKAHLARNAWLDQIQVGDRTVARWESFGLSGRRKKISSGIVRVKQHAMQMNLPARAPIRRGIEDRLPAYGEGLSAAIVAAFSTEGSA